MSRSIHRAAQDDLTTAFAFYRREGGKGVAGRFLDEFERVVALLEKFHEMGSPTSDGRRSYRLTGFPYSLIYRCIDSDIRVLVVRHQSRDPQYGEGRT